ncbi:MAG: beta-ketoacyl-[acyl-carrier-protein] synthase family protein [Planctomycetes bacterium]|nr:beta-ketoacyl-[acyl-carrier-protein] synthase family protein [Planctomycetota bacterium]
MNAASPEKRSVVVTGMGVVCCVGCRVDHFWQAICNGQSGIRPLDRFDTSNHRIKNGGQAWSFTPPDDKIDLATAFALAASRQAMQNAGLDAAEFDSARAGVALATNFGAIETARAAFDQIRNDEYPISSLAFRGLCFQSTARAVASGLGLKGPVSSLSLSCASGNATIGYATDLIRLGRADVMLAGGFDAITEYAWAGLSALKTMTTKEIRPFDLNRSQTIFSEGAGLLLLEEQQHAQARGAPVLAEVAGHGMNNNGHHIAHPSPNGEGTALAMQMALADAGMNPDEIDHINAHGTGTKLNDSTETTAIKTVFGKRAYDIPVNAIKSMIGHVMGAASSVEAIASILSIRDGVIPPTIHYETADPECDLNYVPNSKIEKKVDAVLNNSAGIGGCNAVVIFRRCG